MPAYVRKFHYKEDAKHYRDQLDYDNFTDFRTLGKKGGTWNVVYVRQTPFTVGDQIAIRGVDY